MVNLPLNDGLYIRDFITKYRARHNIPEPEDLRKIYNKQTTFLEEELELVTQLRLTKDLLPYLDYFPNLNVVNITGYQSLSQTEIQSVINKYPNMKDLIIEHQDDLQFLDLSNLTKLQGLEIVSNKNLKNVVGIDKMEDLYGFTFYDNQLYNEGPKKELVKQVYRISHELGAECNFDVLYMPDFINFIEQNNYNLDEVKDYMTWSENLKAGVEMKYDHLEYKTGELFMAYKKAKDIVDKYTKETDTPEQKFAILYQWMCENVKYDYEGLKHNHTNTKDGIIQGRFGGTNGTVNAFMYGTCVCQGYSKSMQMLLKLAGIYSADIGCIAEEKKEQQIPIIRLDNEIHASQSDHSIIKVNLDGKIYYSDVTWDAGRFQKGKDRAYFLLSKADISRDHKLLGEERVVDAGRSVPIQDQEELLKFATERIKKVNEKKEEVINEPKTSEDYLAEYTEKLNELRTKYGQVAKEIENLMIRNSQSPIPNYQQQLDLLLQQRDLISDQMAPLMHGQQLHQDAINRKKEEEHNNIISQVERLLNIRVTSTVGYEYDQQLKAPQTLLKNTSTLRQEQGRINQQLDELYYDGQLDHKVWQAMKKEIRIEYDKMIASAPKPINQNQANVPQNDEVQNTQQNTQETPPTTKEEMPEKTEDIPERFASAYDRVYDSELIESMKEKYGYADMSEEEQERFDQQLQMSMKEMKEEETIEDKKNSADLRREAWKKIKTQYFSNPDLDLEAIIRQQEFNEMQREEIEQMEQVNNVEGHRRGMF